MSTAITNSTGAQGMDPDLLRIFSFQIWTQCKFALLAYEDLRVQLADADAASRRSQDRFRSLGDLSRDEMVVRATEISLEWAVRTWHPIQAFLSAAANISKALWGQGGRFEEQRRPLRASLGVPDSSALRSVTMRNKFDHFDEKLDEWWRDSIRKNYIDLNLGATMTGAELKDMFRSYDPSTGVLAFWTEKYDLPAVVAEIEQIMPIALVRGSRLASS